LIAKWRFYLVLVLIGAAWGATFPVAKIVVSTGYQPFGILVWQLAGAIVLTGGFTLARGHALSFPKRYFGLFFGVAMLGSVVPGYFSYAAAPHLPAGVLAIVIALTPLFSLPIALMLGFEKLSAIRFAGLGFGIGAVVLLVAPDTSLPEPEKAIFVLVAMLATLAYGAEGNFLAWFGTRAGETYPDPVQILFGSSIVGFLVLLPMALLSGQFISPARIWGAPEWGILLISLLSTCAYGGYIWLVRQTGPVFAAQVSYLVTAFGVAWAMLLLRENYSPYFWMALGVMMVGVFLVQPRTLAPKSVPGDKAT
jgi:drug/metabolite transporter (DMT)-like permease